MKYSQACLLKKQMDISINKLAMTVMGLGVTDEARKRLVVTHVSTIHFTRWINKADCDERKTWCNKVQAGVMVWDWDTDDIDTDKDNSKLWVPIMPQMLDINPTKQIARANTPIKPTTPPQQMWDDTVH